MELVRSHEHPLLADVPLSVLQRSDTRNFVGLSEEDAPRDGLEEEEGRLLCGACGNRITTDSACIVVNGSHDHVFRNPGGLVFHVGCFSDAGGCLVVGVFTEEYTWFPGYAWCYVLCAGCQAHLGWRYERGDDGFFGLILDRLVRR